MTNHEQAAQPVPLSWAARAAEAGIGIERDGKPYVVDATALLAAKEQESKDLPSIIPIRPEVSDHELLVTCMDGSIVRLHPQLRYGTLHKSEWITQQIAKREQELEECDDAGTADALFAAIQRLEHDSLALSIPDLPSDLLPRLDQVQYNDLLMVVQRMTRDAQKAVSDHTKKYLAPYLVKRAT